MNTGSRSDASSPRLPSVGKKKKKKFFFQNRVLPSINVCIDMSDADTQDVPDLTQNPEANARNATGVDVPRDVLSADPHSDDAIVKRLTDDPALARRLLTEIVRDATVSTFSGDEDTRSVNSRKRKLMAYRDEDGDFDSSSTEYSYSRTRKSRKLEKSDNWSLKMKAPEVKPYDGIKITEAEDYILPAQD